MFRLSLDFTGQGRRRDGRRSTKMTATVGGTEEGKVGRRERGGNISGKVRKYRVVAIEEQRGVVMVVVKMTLVLQNCKKI